MTKFHVYVSTHKGSEVALGAIDFNSAGVAARLAYDGKVRCAKLDWLERHGLAFDEVHIVKHGTPKASIISDNLACLIDDEQGNRDEWGKGRVYDASDVVGSFFAAIDWLRATRL